MIEICCICSSPKVVPGPRNKQKKGFCGSKPCTIEGLLRLAAEDMLSREEGDHLNALLGDR